MADVCIIFVQLRRVNAMGKRNWKVKRTEGELKEVWKKERKGGEQKYRIKNERTIELREIELDK